MNRMSPPVVEAQAQSPQVPGAMATRAESAWVRGTPRWQYAVLRRMLACADLVAVLLAALSLLVVSGGEPGLLAWGLAFLPAWIVVAKVLGLYDRDESVLRHLTVDELPQLVLWALVGTTSLSVFLELTPVGGLGASNMVVAGLVVTVAVVPLRALVRWAWRKLVPAERVAIVGTKASADAFRRKLELYPDVHMTVVDELDQGDLDEIDTRWLRTIDRLVLVPQSLDDDRIEGWYELSRASGALLTLIPPRHGAFGHSVRLSHLADVPVLDFGKVDLSRSTMLLKRALDLAVSALALVLVSPVLVVIAAAIKADSRGPIIFSQWRAGQGGRPFRMHKFRTMVRDAEELLPGLVRLDELAEPVFKLERDPRVTRVGRWLRRWSLDELPQLVDVLRGDMSLVGPRPEQIEVVDRYSPEQCQRLLVKPGLTGPMQVYGRGALGFDERMAVERDYIENISLGRDIRMLAMTVSAVVRGKGAF